MQAQTEGPRTCPAHTHTRLHARSLDLSLARSQARPRTHTYTRAHTRVHTRRLYTGAPAGKNEGAAGEGRGIRFACRWSEAPRPHEAEHVLVAALLGIRDRISHPFLRPAPCVRIQLWALPHWPAARLFVEKRDETQAQVAWRPCRAQHHQVPITASLPCPYCIVHRQQSCPAALVLVLVF